MSVECEKCGGKAYEHDGELGVTTDCQDCGHWSFEKYDWVDENDLSNDVCGCEYCRNEGSVS